MSTRERFQVFFLNATVARVGCPHCVRVYNRNRCRRHSCASVHTYLHLDVHVHTNTSILPRHTRFSQTFSCVALTVSPTSVPLLPFEAIAPLPPYPLLFAPSSRRPALFVLTLRIILLTSPCQSRLAFPAVAVYYDPLPTALAILKRPFPSRT